MAGLRSGRRPESRYTTSSDSTPTLYPDHYVHGFGEAWTQVIETWRSHDGKSPGPAGCADRLHVETHVIEGRDVFLTDDGPLLVMCRRLRDEHNIPVVAMRLADYLETHKREPA